MARRIRHLLTRSVRQAPGGSLRRGTSLTLFAALTVVLVADCTSSRMVRRDQLVSGAEFTRAAVHLTDGSSYHFPRLVVRSDSLVGMYPISVERRERNEIAIEQTYREYPFALARVDSVTVIRRDLGKTLMVAAGIAAAGVIVQQVTDSSLPGQKESPDHTKPPPG
jgi:hypothetical protein